MIASHKFTLAFENSVSPDYVTEKVLRPAGRRVGARLPGRSQRGRLRPGPHSYIDTADFSGPNELAAYLNRLDQDDEYQSYLAWKQEGLSDSFLELVAAAPDRPFCRLVELVHQRFRS